MDLAQLGLKVDSSDVKEAVPALDRLRDAAKGAERATDEFSDEAERATKATDKLRNSGDTLGKTFGLLKTAMIGFAAGFSLNVLADAADRYTEFNNRLKVAGVTAEDQIAIQQRLASAANAGGAAIGAVGSLYAKASQAANDLGASQESLLNFVDGVTAALKVNGGTAESTSGALMQLGQALGGGVVRAEEFNSILEGAPTIARAAALGFEATGGSVSRLRNMVIQGEVSSKEFFESFLRGSETMKQQAGELSMTIGNSWTVLANGVTFFVGKLDEMLGVSGAVASAISSMGEGLTWLAFNLDTVGQAAVILTPLLLGIFGPTLLASVTSLVMLLGTQLVGAINVLVGAFEVLRLAMLANPLLAIATVITTVLVALYQFREELGLTSGKWAEFWHLLESGWQTLLGVLSKMWELAGPLLTSLYELSMQFYSAIGERLVLAFQVMWQVAQPIVEGLIYLLQQAVDLIAYISGTDISGKAGGAIAGAADNAKSKIIEGHTTGAANASTKLMSAISAGGSDAASKIRDGMAAGGVMSAKQAQATYERLNGTVVKPLGDALVSGGDYIHNQVTGAVTKVGEDTASAIATGAADGGDIAGQKIQSAMAAGSQTVYSSIESAFATLAPLLDVFSAFQRQLNSQIALASAQANLLYAQAREVNSNISNANRYGAGGGGSGGSRSSSEMGGSILDRFRERKASEAAAASQVLSTPGVVTSPVSSNTGGSSAPLAPVAAAKEGNVTIINQLSPSDQLAALQTNEGKKVIFNVIKNDLDEFVAMLGAT